MPPANDITVTAKDCEGTPRSGGAPFTADTKTTFANACDKLGDEMAQHNCPDEAQFWHDIADHIRLFS